MASSTAQIRLRAVVATGFVMVDAVDGWVGSDLNHACRLLDAEALRAALRERGRDIALCVSESVHAGIVRHDHTGIPADAFHEVTVDSKNGPLKAWLHGPLPTAPRPAPPAAVPASSGDGPVDSAVGFQGTNNGIVAARIGTVIQSGTINGGISFGSGGPGEPA
jgi:hypothetical protein